jgi:hypothetical protein
MPSIGCALGVNDFRIPRVSPIGPAIIVDAWERVTKKLKFSTISVSVRRKR